MSESHPLLEEIPGRVITTSVADGVHANAKGRPIFDWPPLGISPYNR